MMRGVLAVVAGLVAWVVVATVANLAVRRLWPDYAAVEVAMVFTLSMLVTRLAIGALASVCAGLVASMAGTRSLRAAAALSILLLIFFVPVHHALWDRFPVWYHLVFLGSLAVLPVCGLRVRSRPGVVAA